MDQDLLWYTLQWPLVPLQPQNRIAERQQQNTQKRCDGFKGAREVQREQCGRNSAGLGSASLGASPLALLGAVRPGMNPSPSCSTDLQSSSNTPAISSYATCGFHHGILSQHLSSSVDSFGFLCSHLTFINMQLIQSSSLLFHGETVWHKLEKKHLPSLYHLMLYSCSRVFPSLFCMFFFCLCVIWSVKCQYYFILLFNKTFSLLHFSPCAFLISIIFLPIMSAKGC